GGGGGWRQRNFVGLGGSAARAGYGFVVTMDLEPGMSGDRRALWTCFCSFKTRRKSYKMGRLNLHDLHERNLKAMQSVVDLGRQLGRPIFTSLWSSRADRPNVGSSAAPGSRGSPGVSDNNSSNRRVFASRPGSLFDVGSAIGGDSGCLGSTLGLGLGSTFGSTTGGGGCNPAPPPPPPAGGRVSRSARHQHPAGSGILSEFALSALSANGGGGSSELSVAIG
ncbi:unnamed protein product, partial [Ectocarpus sp. 12 AP-2014]